MFDRFVHSPSLNERFCIRGDRLHWHLFYLKPLSESAFLENPLNEQVHVSICLKKPFRGKVPYNRNKETNFAENRNTTFKI